MESAEDWEDWGKAFENTADAFSELGEMLKVFKVELDKKPFWVRWWVFHRPLFPLICGSQPSWVAIKFWVRWEVYWPLCKRISNIKRRGS